MTLEEFITHFPDAKRNGSSWIARCPAHEDSNPSLSIRNGDKGIVLKCHAGCSAESIMKAKGLRLSDLFPPGTANGDTHPVHPSVSGRTAEHGLTLKALALAKRLPEALLRSLGIEDCHRSGVQAVRIRYPNTDGTCTATRYRLALEGDRRFAWKAGDKVALYGLDRLKAVRAAGWVLLVEGESDCWTAWHQGIPALGIPGKACWRPAWAEHLKGLEVYLWQEPEAEDLARKVFESVPGLKVIVAPEGVKDISEAHLQGKEVFTFLADLKAGAIPAKTIREKEGEARISSLRAQAAAVLAHEDPLERVRNAFRHIGYGGDLRYPTIAYLSATSRVLRMRQGSMPVHLLLVGSPSAGKSYTLKAALKLLPPDAYEEIDAGSPRVLIYDNRDLRHRLIIFGEADSLPAGEDNPAASAVRALLQDHALKYKVTVRDPETGDFTVREIDRPGPTTLITTSVRRLGPQLDSRLFCLDAPDEPEHVREALKAQAALELGGPAQPDEELVAYQGLLQAMAPWDAVVPFVWQIAEALGRADAPPRILRDFARLISLVKAVAVLRHARRKLDHDGRLVAEVDDYATIFDLVQPMYESSRSGVSEGIRKAVQAVTELRAEGREAVSITMAAERMGIAKSSASARVKAALKGHYLVNTDYKQGRPANLAVGEQLPPPSGLPEPSTLQVAPGVQCSVGDQRCSDEGRTPEAITAPGLNDGCSSVRALTGGCIGRSMLGAPTCQTCGRRLVLVDGIPQPCAWCALSGSDRP